MQRREWFADDGTAQMMITGGGPVGMLFVHTLGTARIDAGNARLTPTSVRKFALLLHLSAEPGRRVPRDVLRELIFPDSTEDNARHSLRELLYGFRRLGVRIDSDKHGMALASDAVASDYSELLAGDRPDPAKLAAAAGGFLPGYAPEHSEAYAEWLAGYRARATFEICKALLKELTRAKRVGDWAQAERAARACLALDPLNEEATLGLAEMLAIGGAKVAAVRLLDEYIEEVGSGPTELKIPASILRRRISERAEQRYLSATALHFVGRESEMTSLSECLVRAAGGEANYVVLFGEAGIGKTRLAEEACARATIDGFRVARVAVEPNDRERPFSAFVDLVPQLKKLPGAIGACPESLDALNRLTTHAEVDRASPTQSDALRSMISHAIDDLVEAITCEVPLLLYVDDVQWLDEMSACVLTGIASTRRQRRLCVFLTTREASVSHLLSARTDRALALRVSALPIAQCEQLVITAAAVDGPLNAPLTRWIATSSAGNPFFLQALITHYATTKQAYRIPQSISALLDRSVLSLSDAARTVLIACVTLGRYSSLQRLLSILELPHIQLLSAMGELESTNLIHQVDERIVVRHALIAEAVARHATPVALKLLHARIASVLELEARNSRNSAIYWVCADHLLVAGQIDRATGLLNECVQHAIDLGQPREAAELLMRAAALSGQPLRDKLAREAVRLARAASEADVVSRALDLIEEKPQTPQHDEIELAEHYARGLCELDPTRATNLANCVLDANVPLEHRLAAGWMMLVVADFQRRVELASNVFSQLDPLLASRAASGNIQALLFYLVYHSCFGDADEAGRVAARLARIADVSATGVRADLYRKAAIGYWRAGLTELAVAALETAFEDAVKAGLARVQVATSLMLAEFLLDLHEDERSSAWLERADRVLDDYPGTTLSAEHYTLLCEAALGRNDEAAVTHYTGLLRNKVGESPVSRAAHWLQALDFWARLRRGVQVDADAALHLLTDHHLIGEERGDPSDNETAMAVKILLQSGKQAAAHQVLDRYLNQCRVGHAPLSRFLQVAITDTHYYARKPGMSGM